MLNIALENEYQNKVIKTTTVVDRSFPFRERVLCLERLML